MSYAILYACTRCPAIQDGSYLVAREKVLRESVLPLKAIPTYSCFLVRRYPAEGDLQFQKLKLRGTHIAFWKVQTQIIAIASSMMNESFLHMNARLLIDRQSMCQIQNLLRHRSQSHSKMRLPLLVDHPTYMRFHVVQTQDTCWSNATIIIVEFLHDFWLPRTVKDNVSFLITALSIYFTAFTNENEWSLSFAMRSILLSLLL